MSPNSNTRYSRIVLALAALVLIAFGLWGLVGQSMSASALTSLNLIRTPTPCHPPKCRPTPTPKPTRTHTPTPTPTLNVKPTPTATATAMPTPTAIAPVASTTFPDGTVTPTSTAPAGNTPTPTPSTPTVGNGNPPSDGGNSGAGPLGSMFTTLALVVGVLAFLLYLIPQRGASTSILNKILSLILPTSVVRRMDDE